MTTLLYASPKELILFLVAQIRAGTRFYMKLLSINSQRIDYKNFFYII